MKFDQSNPADQLCVNESTEGITKDMTQSQLKAAVVARGGLAGHTMKSYAMAGPDLAVTDMVAELRKAGDEVVGNDLSRMERLLVNQSIILDTMFQEMAQKAGRQEYIKQMETYMRLALKAQSQARATIETIGLLKNPMPFIKQANIAQGPQQVNNGKPVLMEQYAHTHAQAGKIKSPRSKVLQEVRP